jgi:transcriptional regulator with XRE-family HTH domain
LSGSETPPGGAISTSNGTLGARVRRLRAERELSLRDVAAQSGLSASLLSQLERDQANPSLQTLQRLALSMGVSIFALLPQDTLAPSATVVRPDNRRKLVIQDGQLRYELLSPDTNRIMEVWMGRLEPGAEMGPEFSTHPSEEFILVLHGRMTITIGDESHVLEEGCSIQYDGHIPHRIDNASDDELAFLSALTPPTL